MIIHKRDSGLLSKIIILRCGSLTGSFSKYWDRVTCPICLRRR